MAIDNREAILVRLLETLKVDGVRTTHRNVASVPESDLPAAVVLDGDEFADELPPGRGAASLRVMNLQPEIYILARTKTETVGTELNAFRRKLIKAVFADATLVALCKDSEISFDGMETSLATGRSMLGEARLNFTFRYVLKPHKL